jgi:hypothetical protein
MVRIEIKYSTFPKPLIIWITFCSLLINCNGQTTQKENKDSVKINNKLSMKRDNLIILSEKSTFQHFQVNYKLTKTAEQHLVLLQDAIKLALRNPKFIEDKNLLYFFILEDYIKNPVPYKNSINEIFLGYAPYEYLYKSDHFTADFRIFWNRTMEPLLKSMNQEKFNQALKPILLTISDPFISSYKPFFLVDKPFFEGKLYKVSALTKNDIVTKICLYIKNGSFDSYEYAEVFLVSLMYSLQNKPEKDAIFNEIEKRFMDLNKLKFTELDKLNLKGQELVRLMLYLSAKQYATGVKNNDENQDKIASCLYKKFYNGEID